MSRAGRAGSPRSSAIAPCLLLIALVSAREARPAPLFTASYISYDTGGRPFGVATADLNHDGFADFVVSNQVTNSLTVLLGAGDGTVVARGDFAAGNSPISTALGDLNGDKIPDAIVADLGSDSM